jgi:hypothetical protein
VDEQAPDPRFEAFWIAQRGQIPPGADERVLNGVLSAIGVTRDQSGDNVQSWCHFGGQALEGVVIALLSPDHECSVHPVPRPARPTAAFTLPWRTK